MMNRTYNGQMCGNFPKVSHTAFVLSPRNSDGQGMAPRVIANRRDRQREERIEGHVSLVALVCV